MSGFGFVEQELIELRRREEHERRRFEAAKAAMQGDLSNPEVRWSAEFYAESAVIRADALLAELAKPQEGGVS